MATYSLATSEEILEYLVLRDQQSSTNVLVDHDFSLKVGANETIEVLHWAMVANDHSNGTKVVLEGWSQGKDDNFDNTNSDGGNRFGVRYGLVTDTAGNYGTIAAKYPNDGGSNFPNPYITDNSYEVVYASATNEDIAVTSRIVSTENKYVFYPGMEIFLRFRQIDGDDGGDNFRFNIMFKRKKYHG